VAFAAIAAGCSLAVSMAQVAADAEAKLRRELRVFGANVALLPADPAAPDFAAAEVDRFAGSLPAGRLRACSPVLEAPATAAGKPLALVGLRWREAPALFAYWRVEGAWPAPGSTGVCLVGTQLAGSLRVQPGQTLNLEGSGGARPLRVLGIIHAGDTADEQCFASLEETAGLAGRGGRASLGLAAINGDAAAVERLARAAAARVPAVTAQPLRALPAAEEPLLRKARALMLAASLALLLLAGLAALTTSLAAAIDREPELALLKAVGWEDREAALLFLAEAALVGLLAGAAGALVALVAGQPLARALFGTSLTPRPALLLLSLLVGADLSLLGAALPARRVLRLDPARALRSE
jgi:putative ABC transport system permease protein